MTGQRFLAAVALLEALRLRWPRRRTYAAFDQHTLPEPVPADWQAIEPRRDCQTCRGTWAAEITPTGFRCLHCHTLTTLTPEMS